MLARKTTIYNRLGNPVIFHKNISKWFSCNKWKKSSIKAQQTSIFILDSSEELMCVFHSDYISKYVNNSRVLAAGTDSLSHEIKTEDICKDIIN